MSPMEALLSATAWGGPMMKMGKQLGYIREGCLADILLVDGDPLADITILQDKARILAVMKDGEFHRAPPPAGALRRAATPPAGRPEEHTMAETLFTNVRILDGTGAAALQRQRAGAGQPHPPGGPQHRAPSRPAMPP
jgi:hypothetical protein